MLQEPRTLESLRNLPIRLHSETCLPLSLLWPRFRLYIETYALLGCSGFARVDLMLEAATDELYVLEADAVPGLTETSLLPQAAVAAGIGFDELMGRIVAAAGVVRVA